MPPIFESLILIFFGIRALKGPKETIEALIVLLFFLLGNPTFTAGSAKNFRYLIFFTGFITVIRSQRNRLTPFSKFLLTFYLVELILIILFGKIPIISGLKLTIFTIVVFTIVESFSITRNQKHYWFTFFNTFFTFAVLSSLFFLILGFGYERNDTGFQGVFAHPQTFGPIMAIIAAWFSGLWLSTKNSRLDTTILLSLSFVFIYMSLSRTSFGASILGAIIAYSLTVFSKSQIPNINRLYGLVFTLFLGLIFTVAINPTQIEKVALNFIQKRESTTTDVGELFEQSRGFLVSASLENFYENPLFGIGLGVPTDYDEIDFSNFQTIAGIPISASVEKGFLPAAILEEMGIIGAILTIILLFLIFSRIKLRFSFMALWLAFSALFINLGEAVLFSVGGLGLFIWLIIGMTYSNDLLMPQKFKVKKRISKPKPNLHVV